MVSYNLDKRNKLNNEPYVKDAILSPMIINGASGLLNNKAVPIKTIVQNTEIILEL